MTQAGPATPLINRRFLVLDALGRGGMGRVFRAFDRDRERVVALKTPHDDRRGGPDHPLTEEYRRAAMLRHPNLVRVLDLHRAREGPFPEDTPFLVLERAAGRPAHRALAPGRAGIATLRAFTAQVLGGLAHVHDAGLVHRDLKPGNLLVDRPRTGGIRVKLTDFGLATDVGTREEAGCISGSLPYLAPESIAGDPVDGRTDLYALGILLYFLSTASLPFRDTRASGILRWHLEGHPADPRRRRRDLPASWGAFVAALTERDPSRRPTCARTALRALGLATASDGTAHAPSAEVATLRLAVDAVRLGGARVHVHDAAATGTVRTRARALARIHDLAYHAVDDGCGGRPGLARAVADLLEGADDDPADLARKHRLIGVLPLEFVGRIAVRDLSRRLPADASERSTRDAARGLAVLMFEAAARRPSVWSFSPAALGDPLVRALLPAVETVAHAVPAPRRGAPGVLVLRPGNPSTHGPSD